MAEHSFEQVPHALRIHAGPNPLFRNSSPCWTTCGDFDRRLPLRWLSRTTRRPGCCLELLGVASIALDPDSD